MFGWFLKIKDLQLRQFISLNIASIEKFFNDNLQM